MKRLTKALLLCTLCATAWGDAVLDWNQAALEAVRARNIPPPRVARDLAILHLAIHDAVNSIARTHESYAFTGRVPAAASRPAAAATAGYHALIALFPHPEDQAMFATLYADQLSMIPDLPPKRMGMEAGMGAAAAILELRAHDGSDQAGAFAGGTEPGQWRPTLSFGGVVRPALLPLWGWVTPFGLAAPDQFRPPAPPPLQSSQDAEELEQVKWWGRDQGSLRNEDQTEIALFWGYGGGTATPPGHWNELAQSAAMAQQLTLEQNARLFALLNMALTDAGISCWTSTCSISGAPSPPSPRRIWTATPTRNRMRDGDHLGDPSLSGIYLGSHRHSAARPPLCSPCSSGRTTCLSRSVPTTCPG